MYDVIVVGAGPAGSFTAKTICEKSDLKVLILDLKKEVGKPVSCAGGVPLHWLKKMGIELPKEIIATVVYGIRLISPSGYEYSAVLDRPGGYIVYRDKFDKFLADQAVKHGAKIELETHVTGLIWNNGSVIGVKTNKGERYGKVIVGADGPLSQVGKWAGIETSIPPDEMAVAHQITIENDGYDPRYLSFYFSNKYVPKGYGWVFPEGRDRLRVGLGIPITEGNPKQLLERFLKKHREYDKPPIKRVGGLIPLSGPLKQTVKGNVLLVGDAARVTCPLTGGGIPWALVTGRAAGEAITSGKLESYEHLWRSQIGDMLEKRYRLKKILYSFDDEKIDRLVKAVRGWRPETTDTKKLIFGLTRYVATKDPSLLPKMLLKSYKIFI